VIAAAIAIAASIALVAVVWHLAGALGIVGLVLVSLLIAYGRWAYMPQRGLSTNRRRDLRYRLALRAHPGKGFATRADLFFRFGRFKMWRQSKRIRPDLGCWYRLRHPDAYSTLV
jgi:hypothetical protein